MEGRRQAFSVPRFWGSAGCWIEHWSDVRFFHSLSRSITNIVQGAHAIWYHRENNLRVRAGRDEDMFSLWDWHIIINIEEGVAYMTEMQWMRLSTEVIY